MPPLVVSLDSEPLVAAPESRFIGAAEGEPRSEDGALCAGAEPALPPAAPPVPCAKANPLPAINAAAATEIIKRLVMEYLLRVIALPAPTTKG